MIGADVDPSALEAALAGGDVASVILSPIDPSSSDAERLDEAAFATRAKQLVPIVQAADAAALVAFEPRVAVRSGADGLHSESPLDERAGPLFGIGNVTDRHGALAAAERDPDYVFFGRLHRDIRPEPHEKNLKLARWWAEIVALPCIVSGGNVVESVVAVAETGADFVALQSAIFDGTSPGDMVAKANELLDAHAPPFETD